MNLTPKQAEVVRLAEVGWNVLKDVAAHETSYRLVSPDGEVKPTSGSVVAQLCNQGVLEYIYDHPAAHYFLTVDYLSRIAPTEEPKPKARRILSWI